MQPCLTRRCSPRETQHDSQRRTARWAQQAHVLSRLKQLTDISGVVIFFPHNSWSDYILEWISWMLSGKLISPTVWLNLTHFHYLFLFFFFPSLTAPPPSLLLAHGSSPFYTGRFLPESRWWLFSFSPTPIRICTFKAASIRRELSLSLSLSALKLNPTWKGPVSCHHLIRSRGEEIMFLAESSNI